MRVAEIFIAVTLLAICDAFSQKCSDCDSYCKCVESEWTSQLNEEQMQNFKEMVACEESAFESAKIKEVESCMVQKGYYEEWDQTYDIDCSACPLAGHISTFEKKIGYSHGKRKRRSLAEIETKRYECLVKKFGSMAKVEAIYDNLLQSHPETAMYHCNEEHCGEDAELDKCLADAQLDRGVWDAVLEYYYYGSYSYEDDSDMEWK